MFVLPTLLVTLNNCKMYMSI